jgi:hypothetical protein
MPPENYYLTTIRISAEEFNQIFSIFANPGIEEPKSKRGRKPKAHHVTDKAVKMEVSK